MMKQYLRLLSCSVLLLFAVSCNDEELVDTEDQSTNITNGEQVEVNYTNLEGTWYLAKWNDEEISKYEDAIYCYISFDRKDKEYVMYENLESMYSRKRIGIFEIGKDKDTDDYILTGEYAYGKGDWEYDYIISELTKDTMVLKTKDSDPEEVSVYVRCEEIPSEIINGTRSLIH